MRVLVMGAAGQLGRSSFAAWKGLGSHVVSGLTRTELDVTDTAAVRSCVSAFVPDLIVNCTAYNWVDDAENAPREALASNAWAVRSLARSASMVGAVLVHYSTDFVFDGESRRPYLETDEPDPQSVYGVSKLLGEWFAADAPRHYVLRVESLFGGPGARSTIDRIISSIRGGEAVRAFSDRTVSPSFVPDVVDATMRLVVGQRPFGLYHCVNGGYTTWLELAHFIALAMGRPGALIEPTLAANTSMRAPRPLFAALDNRKLTAAGVEMPAWQSAVRRYLRLA